MSLKNLTDNELENILRRKAFEERKLTLEIVELLEEVDRRKIYLERGYGSLIEYCVKELKYSEGSAYRRIAAMRVVRDVPETKPAIRAGTLNLVTVAKAQTFFSAEAKARKKYSPDAKKALLEQLHNRGTREAEKLLLALSPGMAPTEKIRPLTPDKSQLTLVVSGQLLEKLERLKDAFCHKLKGGGYVELIERLTDSAIAELERKLKRDRDGAEPAEHNESTEQRNATSALKLQSVNGRYIPAAIKRQVWTRSESRCCYRDPISGRRCSSTRYLEIDHIVPLCKGGTTNLENLQLLCDAHNRWKGARLPLEPARSPFYQFEVAIEPP